jgi:hypothetical protein
MIKTVGLCDNDADGVISFAWSTKKTGIAVQLEDIFGNVVDAHFYKKDLAKTLKKLLKKLEQE